MTNPDTSDSAVCVCGHTAHWHAVSGTAECEHNGRCQCPAFRRGEKPRKVVPTEYPRMLYQCPGCWSYGIWPKIPGGYECDCGERLTLIDLRARREQSLTQDAY